MAIPELNYSNPTTDSDKSAQADNLDIAEGGFLPHKDPLSTLIDTIDIDRDWVDTQFSIFKVSYQGINQADRKKRLVLLAAQIYRAGSVFSLVRDYKNKCYWVMLALGSDLNLNDSQLAVKAVSVKQMPDYPLARLLLKAMPHFLSQQSDQQVTRFEADGLYYLVEARQLPNGHKGYELVAVEVDIKPCDALNAHALSLVARTFSPLSWFRLESGELQRRARNAPRYELNTLEMQIKKSLTGDYIKKPLYPNTKSRVFATDIRKDLLRNFQQSKLGILAQFIKDIEKAYGGAFKLKLKRIKNKQHTMITQKKVENFYAHIFRQLKDKQIVICDKSLKPSNTSASALLAGIQAVGLEAKIHAEPLADALNILIVDEAEQYSEDGDPYKIYRKKLPSTVFQSCYAQSLFDRYGKFKTPVVTVLLKELLIKQEVKLQKLLLEYPMPPSECTYYLSLKPTPEPESEQETEQDLAKLDVKACDANQEEHAKWPLYKLTIEADPISHTQKLAFQEVDDKERENLELDLGEDASYVFGGAKRSPLMYWQASGDYAIFVDSDVQMLPEIESITQTLKALEQGRSKAIPSQLVQDFLTANPQTKIKDQLNQLLDLNLSHLRFDDFDGLKYQGRDAQAFYDELAEQGYLLKASLRSHKDGYFNASLGFFYNKEEGKYFAGSKGSAQAKVENFSHLYVIKHSFRSLPDDLEHLFGVYHLKHKSPTVTPYPFKHLFEFISMQTYLAK